MSSGFDLWLYEYLNTGLSLAGVAVPDWADYARLETDFEGYASDSWMPRPPRHYALAATAEHGGIYFPGIVRQVAP